MTMTREVKFSKRLLKPSLIYSSYFYLETVKNLLRRQKLKIPVPQLHGRAQFDFDRATVDRWHDLFRVSESRDLGLSYFWYASELFYLTIMKEFGFHYRNILHLSHERIFTNSLKIGEQYNVEMTLDDIVRHSKDRIVFVMKTVLRDSLNEIYSITKDTIFLKNVSEDFLRYLDTCEEFGKNDLSEIRGISKRKTQIEGGDVHEFYVSKKLGREYGRVSGDLNPLHTSISTAKIFGFKNAFLQGVCTANIAIKFLSSKMEIEKVKVILSKPLYLKQKIQVIVGNEFFEVMDQANDLVAFGSYSLKVEK